MHRCHAHSTRQTPLASRLKRTINHHWGKIIKESHTRTLLRGSSMSWYHSMYLHKYRQGRLENEELCLNTSVRSRHGETENTGMIMPSEGWHSEESRGYGSRSQLTSTAQPSRPPLHQPRSKGGTQPRELYGVGLIRAYMRCILRRSLSQDAPLSPSSPQDLSGTFNITENYIELASDPTADRKILWIILKREKLDQWWNSQRCGQNRNSINRNWILHLQAQDSRPASLLEFQNELGRRRGKRVRLSRMPRPSRLYEDRDPAL
ncbi:hypothetical protein EDB81DRAFT_769319 [Dactylonectria macrodidyma]|uniref:Uncharacterized protein n=1 Tax=Dactylonectria macrodidyma TaxID=307937 RepID=A0A9P9CXT6_9HYPO|nr:hypothetical protein EDB81DRAFT_769319 [Dactylonectria macrodidyma]